MLRNYMETYIETCGILRKLAKPDFSCKLQLLLTCQSGGSHGCFKYTSVTDIYVARCPFV